MQGYGVPFDILPVDSTASPAANLTALLTNVDGSGRYAGLFLYPSLEAIGALNAEQVAQLRAYQVATGARSAVFGGWATNFGFNPDTAACTSADYPMVFTAATPLGASGIKATASLASLGLYRCAHAQGGLSFSSTYKQHRAAPRPARCAIYSTSGMDWSNVHACIPCHNPSHRC